MVTCPNCNHENTEGALECSECGKPLKVDTSVTRPLDISTGALDAQPFWKTANLGRKATVILHIQSSTDPIILPPARETTLGRADPSTNVFPDLDLTPYRALSKGVSRIHAVIRRDGNDYMLVDLGSVNGTHLNGKRLVPNQLNLLHDGDEIHLGKLGMRVYLKPAREKK